MNDWLHLCCVAPFGVGPVVAFVALLQRKFRPSAKVARLARACPATRFFAYTRSWRRPDIAEALAELSRCRNVRLWYSCDRDTGIPARVPRRVKLAWMQTAADDFPPRADLVFRVHRLRKTVAKRVALAVVCPVENGATGHRTDCGRCRLCIN